MIELDAAQFLSAVTEVRRIATILEQNLTGGEVVIDSPVKQRLAQTVSEMRDHLALIGAQSAWVAADRFANKLSDPSSEVSYDSLKDPIRDIESRFADHLAFIRLFVIRGEQISLLGHPAELLGEPTASRFTSIWFDCEEAAKCICVQRPTAAVFHTMRMLEVGIRAFALRLGIEDPIKPSQRNWGVFLRQIKAKIDADYPASSRLAGSEGAFLEGLYATLDAVKNPWRNETMHVEGVYADAEARFILGCAVSFIQKMARSFNERGEQVEEPQLGLGQTQT